MNFRISKLVAQASKPAVSQVSKSARLVIVTASENFRDTPISKSAIRQVWKPTPLSRGLNSALVLFAFLLQLGVWNSRADNNALTLWYQQPAAKWTEALPIGNGRMGAMIFGRTADERIQFNEDTLWRGQPHDYVRGGAGDQLAELRRLLLDENTAEAQKLAKEKFLSDPVRQMPYQPFGDLHLRFADHDQPADYRRELDLDSAIATTSYRIGEVSFRREAFASYPDQVMVIHLTADHFERLSFTLEMDSPHTNSQTRALGFDTLSLTGQLPTNGLRFESRVKVVTSGGSVKTDGHSITIQNANSATLYLTAATSFKNFQNVSANPAKRCAAVLKKIQRPFAFPRRIEFLVPDALKIGRLTSRAAARDQQVAAILEMQRGQCGIAF